ncbi:PXMP2 4 family 4 [Micractinium conductrix]|uniref:PXMP2 4 family 4 n=1 Tax=Micractinium conductrix TaxID=554055 RepID=A0A2P6VNN2_9CHLO|nr:PXMP2 4 family 4 [Micractinium conductrix]|eukprot:PSC75706.1 PXMP2 4 family 4 [Micractinium conductrix]
MGAFGFALPSGSGPWFAGRARQPRGTRRLRSASDAAAGSAPGQQQGMNPVLKSGLISGSLSLAGDMLAQFLTSRQEQTGAGYDAARAARMGSFGLLFYGPYQYFWYRALDRSFPGRSLVNFASKVTLNQLALAPVTITMAFALNLAFQGQLGALPAKLRADFLPTMKNGWKFWIPAASVNFFFMPLQYQVLYMSTCGMLWTGYLSYAGAKKSA